MKKTVTKTKPIKKVASVKKDQKKGVEEIFVNFHGSCDCSNCPSKCC